MIFENIPKFFARMSDIVFPGRNRARIVIGTDRKDTRESGYGDGGDNVADSATIDVVAGFAPDGHNPDYQNDKSRIYISGKTDPDDYFGINKGTAAEGEPAVVGISDNIYLKARKKTKIIGPDYSITMIDGDMIIDSNNSVEVKVGSNKVKISSSGVEIDGQTKIGSAAAIEPAVLGNQLLSWFGSAQWVVAGSAASVSPSSIASLQQILSQKIKIE